MIMFNFFLIIAIGTGQIAGASKGFTNT